MLHPSVATVLAQIACHDNGLPQGSPCSPVISNLIGHLLDLRLCKLATRYGCTYSRYADDITFSTNKPDFPSSIAEQAAGQVHTWEVGDQLRDIIDRTGFTINDSKTRMQYRSSRQDVTGLVVNKKVNIRSEYRRNVRAMAQNLFLTGQFQFIMTVPDPNGVLVPTKVNGKSSQLQGMLGHIDYVDRHNQEMESKRDGGSASAKMAADRALRSKQALYRRFLLFKDFYSADRPVIVCEGKTDNVYLLCAIKSLAASYPKLASVSATSKAKVNVRLLETSDSSAGRILHLGHGASDLARLIEHYWEALAKFKAPGLDQPFIVLVDNDKGADDVYNAAKRVAKKVISKAAPFSHVFANLYLVITPLSPGAQQSEIEDSFDDTIKNLTLGGKKFSSASKPDPTKHFGKAILAQYVRENAARIDFVGFKGLLDRITAAIEDYDNKKAAHVVTPASAVSP
jgi:RNA-directed DNA polymerase